MRLPIRVGRRGRAYSGLRVHGERRGDGAVRVRMASPPALVDVRLSVCLFPLAQTVAPASPPSHRRLALFPLPTWISFDRSDAVCTPKRLLDTRLLTPNLARRLCCIVSKSRMGFRVWHKASFGVSIQQGGQDDSER